MLRSSSLLVPVWRHSIRTAAHETRRQASSAPRYLSRGRTGTLSEKHGNNKQNILQNKRKNTSVLQLVDRSNVFSSTCTTLYVCSSSSSSYLENPDAQKWLQHEQREAHEVHYLKAKRKNIYIISASSGTRLFLVPRIFLAPRVSTSSLTPTPACLPISSIDWKIPLQITRQGQGQVKQQIVVSVAKSLSHVKDLRQWSSHVKERRRNSSVYAESDVKLQRRHAKLWPDLLVLHGTTIVPYKKGSFFYVWQK